MIYIVDEDIVQLQALVAVLEFSGYAVTQFGNADDALDALESATDVELVLIDVMLGTRDSSTSRFSRTETQDFLTTGLELARLLAECGNDAYPKRLAFLSMASSAFLIDQIRSRAKKLGIPYFDKRDVRSIMEFGDRLHNIIIGLK